MQSIISMARGENNLAIRRITSLRPRETRNQCDFYVVFRNIRTFC